MTGKLLVALALLSLFTTAAFASPSLVCDAPQAGQGIQYYVITGLPAALDGSRVPAEATGTFGFKLDLAACPIGGPYTIKARACKSDAAWGEVCSADSLPFVFSRPSGPSGAPINIKLAPQ